MMNSSLQNIDALIFDMDGTLWDATSSYAIIWNTTCASFGIDSKFTGQQLTHLMGKSLDEIMQELLGEHISVSKSEFLMELEVCEDKMMPELGGQVYPAVLEGLNKLHSHFRLFMLSNCSAKGLKNFAAYTGTTHLFERQLTQGERRVSKAENLSYLKKEYSLANPIYVGDTQADCDQAHMAGLSFAFAEWGFGNCCDADYNFVAFDHLVESLMCLSKNKKN